jgi:hypothetical protein
LHGQEDFLYLRMTTSAAAERNRRTPHVQPEQAAAGTGMMIAAHFVGYDAERG